MCRAQADSVRFGLRAVEWESGAVRLIYIVRGEAFPIFLIAVYAKNEKENLTRRERNMLAKRADEIFTNYRRVSDGNDV